MTAEDWPNPLEGTYELRVTWRARQDLGATGCASEDLDAIAAATPYSDLVTHFRERRTDSPQGTEAPIGKLHRGDVYAVHAQGARRGATWYD